MDSKKKKEKFLLLDAVREAAVRGVFGENTDLFNLSEIELLMKTKGVFVENNIKVYPKHGIILSVVDSNTKAIELVAIVDFPVKVSLEGHLEGLDFIKKSKVIKDTNDGVRYTTITRTKEDPWVPGQLVHTDGNHHISTNPNDTTKDNLDNLADGKVTIEEFREVVEELNQEFGL